MALSQLHSALLSRQAALRLTTATIPQPTSPSASTADEGPAGPQLGGGAVGLRVRSHPLPPRKGAASMASVLDHLVSYRSDRLYLLVYSDARRHWISIVPATLRSAGRTCSGRPSPPAGRPLARQLHGMAHGRPASGPGAASGAAAVVHHRYGSPNTRTAACNSERAYLRPARQHPHPPPPPSQPPHPNDPKPTHPNHPNQSQPTPTNPALAQAAWWSAPPPRPPAAPGSSSWPRREPGPPPTGPPCGLLTWHCSRRWRPPW